ncbi:MAG: GIY-YIG nuclease family protein [Flavobacteriales bacterium]|nr:GIY-YIG nuclease family protein [Flavobacteriales bacterium]
MKKSEFEKHIVYVIYSTTHQRNHVGICEDLEEIVELHNSGRMLSTAAFKPWKLIHSEECESRPAAKKRDTYFKSTLGRAWLLRTYKV